MSGQFGFQFKYWFNPVPNERSLEYSGENLLKRFFWVFYGEQPFFDWITGLSG
jgi:hypothetical protein